MALIRRLAARSEGRFQTAWRGVGWKPLLGGHPNVTPCECAN